MAEPITLKLEGKYADELRQSLSYRWSCLEKLAKKNEDEGIDSDAREKMSVIEEIMRTMEPQKDWVDELSIPPESYES